MKTGSIYIIRNSVNDKVYIGQTKMSLQKRFALHCKPSTQKQKGNYKLYVAMKMYGTENFNIELIEGDIPVENLDEKEIEYIEKFDSYVNGYNSNKGGKGRIICKDFDEDKIVKMASSGKKVADIAAEFGVCRETIFRVLRRKGFYYHVNPDEVVSLAKAGMMTKDIAKQLGVDSYTVSRILDKNGMRKHKKPVRIRDDISVSEIEEDYYSNMPIIDICRKHNISKTVFYRIKKQRCMKSRPQVYKHKIIYK